MPCPSRSRAHFFAVSHSGEAPPGMGCHRCYSAIVEMRTKGDVISNPGRRLALCVAPYFADRGVGDMRGTQTAPQYATPEVVAGRHCTRNHVVHKMIHTAPRRKHSPAPPPGCDCVQERFGTPRMSPRPRVAKYGVTHGCHHLRGGGNARLRSSSLPRRDDIALRTPQGDGSRPPLRWDAIGRKPRGGVPDHNPTLTQLCRDKEVPSHDCVPKVRPSLHHTQRNRGVPLAHIPYISCKPGTTA